MRPILMACGGQAPLTFDPVAGNYTATDEGQAEFTISASYPVVWNWSSTGSLPTSTVANGGSATSITLTLNTRSTGKSCTITVTAGGNSWTIVLNATQAGGTP